MNIVEKIRAGLRFGDFLLEPKAMSYLLKAGRGSISSFRICKALNRIDPTIDTVLDVGANQGQFACAISYWFPRAKIEAFEPTHGIYEKCVEATRRSPLVRVHKVAVGDYDGVTKFYTSSYSLSNSVLPPNSEQIAVRPETETSVITEVPIGKLDTLLAGAALENCLLKIDVQGLEPKVLAGAIETLKQVKYVLLETSFIPLYQGEMPFPELSIRLGELGFTPVCPIGIFEDTFHRVLQVDMLWKNNMAL